MALIPVEEINKPRSILDEPDTDVGFRWLDIAFMIVFSLLAILFIIPPQESIVVEGVAINTRIIILLLMIILYTQKAVMKFDEYERGVVLRFGKFKEVYG